MKKLFGTTAALCLILTGPSSPPQRRTTTPPPKILQIIIESLKPGQGGSPHMKTESAFVRL